MTQITIEKLNLFSCTPVKVSITQLNAVSQLNAIGAVKKEKERGKCRGDEKVLLACKLTWMQGQREDESKKVAKKRNEGERRDSIYRTMKWWLASN